MERNTHYASYLLRLRRVQNNDRPVWVASLQSTATGEQRAFADLEALVAFLQAQFGDRAETPRARPSDD
jgi:hypothetical protein